MRWGILGLAGLLVWGFSAVTLAQDSDSSDADEFYEDYEELWQQGEYNRALAALERIIDEQARRYDKWIYRRAKLRFLVGRVDEAIEDMESIANSTPQPWYYLETALMHKYRGHPNRYDQWIQKSIPLLRGRRLPFTNRSENVAAIGQLYEILGNNPKSILGTHFTPLLDGSQITLGAPAFIGAGDVAYRTGGYDIASKYYTQALVKDSDNQDALAGLAECFWKSHDRRLTPALENLLSRNPNHPRATAIVVSNHLDLGETAEAMNLIDKMLDINPTNTQFLAFKAVAHYINDDSDALDSVVERALDFNPVCSEFYQALGRFASRHYRFTDGAAFQRAALALDPTNQTARELYSLDLLRLGHEEEGRVQLERVFEENPYSVMAYNLLEMMDTLAEFAVVERGDFVLKLPKREKAVMSDASLDLLDEAIAEFEAKYEVELEKPVLIEMFDNHDDFMVRSVGLPGNVGHMGICFGKLITMDAPSVRPKGSSNWRSVLWHEFVHVITLQKTKNRMPRWLSEGISVYEEGVYSPAFHNRLELDYLEIILADGKPTVTDLNLLFTKTPSPGHLMFAYFMSGEFVQFYVDTYGFKKIVDALEMIANKVPSEQALEEASGMSLDALNGAFHAYLDVRLKPYEEVYGEKVTAGPLASFLEKQFKITDLQVPKKKDPEIEKMAKNAPHAIAMRKAEKAIKNKEFDLALEALDEAFALFPDYDGEQAPLRQRAMIFKEQQNEAAFIETLERIIAWAPSELSATEELVRRFRASENWERMMDVADWGLGIDPYSTELHKAYADGLALQGEEEKALEQLDLLLQLDRGNWVDYRFQKAELLTKMELIDPAKAEVLGLLEEVPNFWKAQELLLKLAEHVEVVETSQVPVASEVVETSVDSDSIEENVESESQVPVETVHP
ncbi:tetratricopeptide repeat protein [bacterium AH-315-P07]|nr:tetratricopeptide repeat protein [bacterium AH-315-P07]